MAIYQNNSEHLTEELNLLDLWIKRRVLIIREQETEIREISNESIMFISHQEVDALLAGTLAGSSSSAEVTAVEAEITTLQADIANNVTLSLNASVSLGLHNLSLLFGLSPFEMQILVICLAPELHRKYDKLYIYLQDDITRRKPSIDLVLDLYSSSEAEKWQNRKYFSADSPLFRHGILEIKDDPHSPSGSSDLACFLQLDGRILDFILGYERIDSRLSQTGAALLIPPPAAVDENLLIEPEIKDPVIEITKEYAQALTEGKQKPVIHLYGPRGVGKRQLALEICRQLNVPMLYIDPSPMIATGNISEILPRLAFREGVLLGGVVFIDKCDQLWTGEPAARSLSGTMSRLLEEYAPLTILAGEKVWTSGDLFLNAVVHSTRLPVPPVNLRQTAWENHLPGYVDGDPVVLAAQLAAQFRLTPGQTQDAVQFAYYQYVAGSGSTQTTLTLENLTAACRLQSNQKLTELAVKTQSAYTWDDLVLEAEKKNTLQDICSQVEFSSQVFEQWGFGEKLSHGKGLSVLFSGLPGTGKTMAAGVIAKELELDMYKIDLSRVVSKFIGETEKNLGRIFDEAESSNAILFFDEADALFGKRTEITDSHDRYANIETGFLLQKMEDYEGIVILSTNLRDNMDEAFMRRIRFIIDFPFPEQDSRKQIWQTHFPAAAPLEGTIDYDFLADKVQVSGGNIKNIVLNAAFLAAKNGTGISMEHILNSVRYEFEKIGKLYDESQFII